MVVFRIYCVHIALINLTLKFSNQFIFIYIIIGGKILSVGKQMYPKTSFSLVEGMLLFHVYNCDQI